jgi:hypothetical protein
MFAAYQGGPFVEVFTPQVRLRRETPSLDDTRVSRRPRMPCSTRGKISDWCPGKVRTLDGGRGERLRALWKESPFSPAWPPNAIETLPGGPRWFNRRPGRAYARAAGEMLTPPRRFACHAAG